MGKDAISYGSSAERPTGPYPGREAGAAGSSSHSHDEGELVMPALWVAIKGNRSRPLESGAVLRLEQQPAGQTRPEQQLLTAFPAVLRAVCAVASLANDKIATTAASAIKVNRKSFERDTIWISWPDYVILHV
jgi:hypothetical protein